LLPKTPNPKPPEFRPINFASQFKILNLSYINL